MNVTTYPLHLSRNFERRWSARAIGGEGRRSPSRGTDNCTVCGHVVTAPVTSTYLPTGKIINEWQCSACHNSWHTFVYPECNTDAPVSRSGRFRVNAGNYLMLVNTAPNDAARHRFARMSDAWFALADTQDWLDGVTSPALSAATMRVT